MRFLTVRPDHPYYLRVAINDDMSGKTYQSYHWFHWHVTFNEEEGVKIASGTNITLGEAMATGNAAILAAKAACLRPEREYLQEEE